MKPYAKDNNKLWKFVSKQLRNKFKFIVFNEDTLDEEFSFRLSLLTIFFILGGLSILSVLFTSYIIAFTPLKQYIPGYTDAAYQKKVYELQLRSDSISKALQAYEKYYKDLKMVLNGDIPKNEPRPAALDEKQIKKYQNIKDVRSKDDSLMRLDYENTTKYNLFTSYKTTGNASSPAQRLTFFSPLKGIVTNEFNAQKKHYGVDVVANKNEVIKSIQNGTVIFADWTVKTGNVIAIQHAGNIISVYKHNSVLLKREGNVVKAGESIAVVGNSGELTSGPHMHMELWINGSPVNPKDYITF